MTIVNESINCSMSESDISNLLRLSLLLYADDKVVLSENPTDLQSSLNLVKQYCNKWKLKFNVNKCKIIIFSRGKGRKMPQFVIGKKVIEVVQSHVYLGLTLNYNNKRKIAHKDLYDRASRAIYSRY